MNKTILFVYVGPFYPVWGGIERVTDTLARFFIQKGYPVLYLFLNGKESASAYDFPAPVFFFPEEDLKSPENIKFYHQFLRKQKVDLIINQSGSFPESKLFLDTGDVDVQTVSVLHCNPAMGYEYLFEEYKSFSISNKITDKLTYYLLILPFFPLFKRRLWLKKRMHYRFLSENSNCICLLSDRFRKELLALYPVPEEKIIVIPNPNSFTSLQYPAEKKKVLLYVGRLEMLQKRPDRLLNVWERIYREFPEWELKFIGEGDYRDRLEKTVGEKKLSGVSFNGYKFTEPYYKDASILCLVSNYEGWGMVLTEAMQYGAVPIAFDSYGSVNDIITSGKNGMLIKPFDLDEYAAKLRELMRDHEKWEKMSHAAFEDVKKFDEKEIEKQWLTLFEKIMP